MTESEQIIQNRTDAIVHGKALDSLPSELYIPPNALKIYLEAFEGPLDLLLYLIKKQNLDISEISIAKVTAQYMGYIKAMDAMRIELASKYLVMAALLAEIKSRFLLPKSQIPEEEDDDPTITLIKQLQEYERIKQAAAHLDELPRVDRDIFVAEVLVPEVDKQPLLPEIALNELMNAFSEAIKRADYYEEHAIRREMLSVRERMTQILDQIGDETFFGFERFFILSEGKQGVITSFLAILELIKLSLILFMQNEIYGHIYIKVKLPDNSLTTDKEL